MINKIAFSGMFWKRKQTILLCWDAENNVEDLSQIQIVMQSSLLQILLHGNSKYFNCFIHGQPIRIIE